MRYSDNITILQYLLTGHLEIMKRLNMTGLLSLAVLAIFLPAGCRSVESHALDGFANGFFYRVTIRDVKSADELPRFRQEALAIALDALQRREYQVNMEVFFQGGKTYFLKHGAATADVVLFELVEPSSDGFMLVLSSKKINNPILLAANDVNMALAVKYGGENVIYSVDRDF